MIVFAWEKWALGVVLCLIALVYSLGLPGDFAFDDGANLSLNSNFVFIEFDLRNIIRATFSSESGPFGRPVAMFSFALNQYFSGGLYPLGFKVTNIGIHLVNVVLLFVVVKYFFSFSQVSCLLNKAQQKFLPVFTAAIWGGHPLALTSVLYVIQRMTSLSATFMLLGLIAYLSLRFSELNGKTTKPRYFLLLLMLVFSIVAAVMTKETALLYGFFVAVIEVYFLRFSTQSGRSRLAMTFVLVMVIAPVVVLGIRALMNPDWILSGYSQRPFSLVERLLTQARVIFFYLFQIFIPIISQMGIFHDDIALSLGLFDPPVTFIAVVACVLLVTFCCFSSVSKNGLFRFAGFSVAWFLIGHLLESTIFALEIAHEHRNYFPMIGPVLLITYFLSRFQSNFRFLLGLFPVMSVIALCFFLTGLRATSWRNLTDHSLAEVINHPESPRAQYQMGRVYLKWFEETGDHLYLSEAQKAFESSIRYDWEGRNSPYFGLIYLAYRHGGVPETSLLEDLRVRVRSSKVVSLDVAFLVSLAQCQIAQLCKMPDEEFLAIAEAYLENRAISMSARSDIYSTVGTYYVNKIDERAAAERFFISALEAFPSTTRYLDLAEYYRITARFVDSREQIRHARRVARPGDEMNIEKTEQRLRESEIVFNKPSGS